MFKANSKGGWLVSFCQIFLVQLVCFASPRYYNLSTKLQILFPFVNEIDLRERVAISQCCSNLCFSMDPAEAGSNSGLNQGSFEPVMEARGRPTARPRRHIRGVAMCSIMGGLTHRKLQSINSQSYNSTASTTYDDDFVEWCTELTFVARLIAYVAILTLLVIVTYLITRYINDYYEERSTIEDVANSAETSPLQPAKTMPLTYGTCDELDTEAGNCSSSSGSSSNSSNGKISSSSEDLYNGKLCVICYTEQRDCFLVPCGHCATCYVCAQRIFYGETKTCPICRRLIRRVRKLFAA